MGTITSLSVLLVSTPEIVSAQITPDATLGNENSLVTPGVNIKNQLTDVIEGGAKRENSLFHSFSEFNVNNGQRVYFANPSNINNIFSRVTGNNVSHILGTLGVNGNANLYLLNPNGIIFGKDATLDIQGSFFATTANSFIFPDESEFSAIHPQMPLLTMSVPDGVQFGSQPGDISSQGILTTKNDLTLSAGNLDLQGTLTAGNDLTLEAIGDIQVSNTNINSTSVTGSQGNLFAGNNLKLKGENLDFQGKLTANKDLVLEAIGDIQVSNTNINSTSKTGKAGNISLIANGDVSIKNSNIISNIPKDTSEFSKIQIISVMGSVDIADNTTVSAKNEFGGLAGDIYINAENGIQIKNSQINADGNFGRIFLGYNDSLFPQNIEINYSKLTTTDKKPNSANARSDGRAGLISIKSDGNTTITNDSKIESLINDGNGGSIDISTDSLFINKSKLDTSISGTGTAGNITINVQNETSLSNAGRIINAVLGGAEAKGGNIAINTGSLDLTNDAYIDTSTFGKGDTGNILIIAKDMISLDNSKLYNQVEEKGVGNGGNVNIIARKLSLSNNSQINASAFGQGSAGNIEITSSNINLNSQSIIQVDSKNTNPESSAGTINLNTDFLKLDNAFLTAKNESGKGGDIDINTQIVLLRHDSEISSKAGSRENPGDGGTITINAKDGYIIAVPTEDSDIIANAFGGQGGKIDIQAVQTFGLTRRKGLNTNDLEKIPKNRSSDISASSDSGDDGDVEIQTLGIDPSQGLVAIPTDLVDPSGLIAQGCNYNNSNVAQSQSEFVVTGRGGIPPSPDDVLTPGVLPAKWVTRAEGSLAVLPIGMISTTAPLVEAQGMVRNANGDIVLIAQPVIYTNFQSGLSSQLCGVAQKEKNKL
jgi:filamentous hemagglutinin family protein